MSFTLESFGAALTLRAATHRDSRQFDERAALAVIRRSILTPRGQPNSRS